MTIGEKIKLYRKSLGMTQSELAKLLDTTPEAIHKYEFGIVTNIPISKIQRMAEIFGVKPVELIGWYSSDTNTNTVSMSNCKQSTAIGQYVGDGTDKKNEISEALAEIYQMLTKDNRTKLIIYAAKLLSEQSDPDG